MLFLLIAIVSLAFIVSYFVNKPNMEIKLNNEDDPDVYTKKSLGTVSAQVYTSKQKNQASTKKGK